MPAIVGVSLAVLTAVFARATGFDRDRVFYPVVLLVVGHDTPVTGSCPQPLDRDRPEAART